jgi:hypothetical protein
VSWWNAKTETLEPPAAPATDRVEEAQQRVRELKAALDSLDAAMLKFKTENKIRTDNFGRLLSVHSPGMNGYAAIEHAWRDLLHRRDGLVAQWHAALHSWSALKMRMQTEAA